MRTILILAILMVPFFSGCGGHPFGAVKVTGTVTLNGDPVDGVNVTFIPSDSDGRESYGETDASGRFVLTIPGTDFGSGAIPGEYAITFFKTENPAAGMSEDEIRARFGGLPNPVDVLPVRYRDRTGPDVTSVTVEARGKNDFTFELTSP